MKIEYYKTIIGLLLQCGSIQDKDLIPIIKRGIAKWMGKPQKKIFKK